MKNLSMSSRKSSARAMLAGAFLAACAVAQPVWAATSVDSLVKMVKFDDINGVKKALAQGSDPNTVDSTGTPILVIAAREKSDKVGALLASNDKTDLEKLDPAGENAMMLAALNGDVTFLNTLIAKDAEVNKKGWTPLHYAATNGHDDVVKILLDHSAYIDAGSPNGTTPLMMAARGGHLSTCKLLLDEGADLRIKNQIGMTAVDFATKYNEKDVAEGLQARLNSMPNGAAQGANGAK
ncbi:ankyrin repeat domain-containing protein [Caballeronia sp. BR00000012568055]|uniref:ankyrin repeat domain-containing protein n=1 Tax=Caballeronia sp. BR00000012568055 TaxID=2918761 RepID=UPI0023F7E62F|nr:ankyrin repeat domain-containing protein [Caballeronia sp. BR00000012568055]